MQEAALIAKPTLYKALRSIGMLASHLAGDHGRPHAWILLLSESGC
jgi:hypothetical protein